MNNQTIQKLKEILLKKRKSIIQINKINAFIWNDLTKRYSTFVTALWMFINLFIVTFYLVQSCIDNTDPTISLIIIFSCALSGIYTAILIIFLFIERIYNIKIKENKFTNNKFIKFFVLMLYFLFILCAPFFLLMLPYGIENFFDIINDLPYIYQDILRRIF